MRKNTKKSKVFLDSSMLIAAVLSSSGGSFYILNQLHNQFEFQINKFVFEEIQEVLSNKFSKQPELKSKLLLLLGLANVVILENPPKKKAQSLIKIIEKEDAPILASALNHSTFLITLDNDFLTEKVLEHTKRSDLAIVKPKDFIEIIKRT